MRRSSAAVAVTMGLVVIGLLWLLMGTQPRSIAFTGRWRFFAQDSLDDAASKYRSDGDLAGLAGFEAAVAREGLQRLAPFEVTIEPSNFATWRVAVAGAPSERGRWATAPRGGIILTFDTPVDRLSGSVVPPETFQLFWRDNGLWLDSPGDVLLPLRRLPSEHGIK